jgi:hypothetical protein
MKNLLFLGMLFLSKVMYSQFTTTQPDTVCYQTTTLSTYTVTSVGNGTYNWTAPTCATIATGQGTNTIQVNWSNCPIGLINNAITVNYVSPENCPTNTTQLDVLIYNIQPTITQIGPFCESDPCVVLNGSPTNGIWSGNGVTNNQFCPNDVTNGVNANSTITYTINSGGCTFTTSVVVSVYGTPLLTPISHD